MKAHFFLLALNFACTLFENVDPSKVGSAFYGGTHEGHFLFVSSLALPVSSLKMSAPVRSAGRFTGVPMRACFFFFAISFASIRFDNVGSSKVRGAFYGGTYEGPFRFFRAYICLYALCKFKPKWGERGVLRGYP